MVRAFHASARLPAGVDGGGRVIDRGRPSAAISDEAELRTLDLR